MGRSRGPRKSRENKEQLNLFEWLETTAAKLGARLEDISVAALTTGPVVLTFAWTGWFNAPEASTLRPILALTTIIAGATAAVPLITRAFHSWFDRKGIPIALHAGSLAGLMLVASWMIFATWHWDVTRTALRAEEAAKARELEEKRRADQEAAASALQAAKERQVEEKRKADEEAAAVVADCLAKRGEAMKRATRLERTAKSRLEECQTEHAKKILSLQTAATACKSAQDEVDAAKGTVMAVNGKVCSTGSISKGGR